MNAGTASMLEPAIRIRTVSATEAVERNGALAEILSISVAGGATVSFLAPLARDKAEAFWRRIARDVALGARALLIAEDPATGGIAGTVQLLLEQVENAPHRAEVQKLLVHPSFRKRGVGTALMRAVEPAARACGKSLLMLDTTQGSDAERIYQRLGWIPYGVMPGHALSTDGRPSDTSFFYKQLV